MLQRLRHAYKHIYGLYMYMYTIPFIICVYIVIHTYIIYIFHLALDFSQKILRLLLCRSSPEEHAVVIYR